MISPAAIIEACSAPLPFGISKSRQAHLRRARSPHGYELRKMSGPIVSLRLLGSMPSDVSSPLRNAPV